MYLVPDLLEEIFLGLPLRSVVKFRTVSKQWRSILESLRFAERRRMMNAQTKTKIMAAGDRSRTQTCFKEDEEVEIVYLQCDVASRPSLSCDGLVCIPVPGWVNVFNPSTEELLRFSSGRDPPIPRYANNYVDCVFDVFPGYWRMGFGRDNVSGSYKIVRMGFNHHWEIHRCEILDVNIGRWQKLSPPPYEIGYRRKSTCVNGSIYWVEVLPDQKLLALDLHAQEWRDVGLPLGALGKSFQVANLENRLALAATYIENDHWNVKIWSVEAPEETWSMIYSIRLFPLDHPYDDPSSPLWYWTRPVAVSKKGNLFVQDSYKRLFKCYPETGEVRLIAAEICVISPFVENLVPLGRLDSKTYGLIHLDHVPLSSRIFNFFRRMELKRSSILVTTTVVTLVMFRYCSHLSRSISIYHDQSL
ncbi:F-box/LRR-repeat protein At2g43260 [Brassica rapa]|uniref:F-box/LRR-repeat protein At2g43260 n=1 Tax=Brassica campestris TaxID=3711 RepID=UPI0004F19BE9|nr:F-box/LRR-repeat protein At2g43260 [Brassica rapa]